MTQDLIAQLRAVDTPTVCNAIEVVEGRRGFDRFTRGTMLCSAPDAPPVVGFARTATIAGKAPPAAPADVIRARRMDYYRYMATAPAPSVCVIEDVDFPDCIGAFWGEINTMVHRGFGIAGTLTNGVMRDLGELPDGFPVIAGSVGPSHGFVHVRDIDCPVTIHGLRIEPGELVHADRHGAAVIPGEMIAEIGAAIGKLQATERIVLDAAASGSFTFAEFEAAWAAYEKART